MLRWWVGTLIVLWAGCYQPRAAGTCKISCGPAGECPTGLVCGHGNLCAGPNETCGEPVDAPQAILEAAVEDAAIDALPVTCPPGPLRACWLMEGDGHDGSGNNNQAMPVGVGFEPGKVGQAAIFDAAARMSVTLPSATSLDLTAAGGTIEVWLRPAAFPMNDPELRAGIYDNNAAYSMFITSTGQIRCSGGSGHVGGQLELGKWSHAACLYDQEMVSVIVDGVRVAGGEGTSGGAGDGNVDIGADAPWAAGDGQYEGAIDQLFIWDEPRSLAQLCASAGLTCGV